MPPPIISACGCAKNCVATSLFKLPSETALVTIIPVAVEIKREGICDTSPSPIVAIEYTDNTSENVIVDCTIPIIVPAIKLIAVMIIDITASPFTIFVAPSIEP